MEFYSKSSFFISSYEVLQKMPNVDLKVKAEIVNYDRHGFSRPDLWHRPIAKVDILTT